jgi:hypothetical protein
MSKVFDHLLPAFRTYALLPDEERIETDLLNEELLTHSLVFISDRHVRRSSNMNSP